jgi:hypothetical protein
LGAQPFDIFRNANEHKLCANSRGIGLMQMINDVTKGSGTYAYFLPGMEYRIQVILPIHYKDRIKVSVEKAAKKNGQQQRHDGQ